MKWFISIDYHSKSKTGNFIDFSIKNDNWRHICCTIEKKVKIQLKKVNLLIKSTVKICFVLLVSQ